MTSRTIHLRSAFAAATVAFAVGCSGSGHDDLTPPGEEASEGATSDIDLERSAPRDGELATVTEIENLGSARFGERSGDRLLASVSPTPTHRIEFWESAGGAISVVEQYHADQDEGPKLAGFRAGHDSYAAAYESLAGDAADPAALGRLRSADAARASAESSAPSAAPARRRDVVDAVQSDLFTTDGLVLKGVAEDKAWWETICAGRRRHWTEEDYSLCYTATLTPSSGLYWKLTHTVDEYEEANIMLFNAATSGVASLFISGKDCGFLELGPCTLSHVYLEVPPRNYMHLYKESDDGFVSVAQGKAIGVHYVYWE